MSWAVGYDDKWKRDIGYGVPSICDHPDCDKEIDRGLSHVCGGEPYGGEYGCGLYFCNKHLSYTEAENGDIFQACECCESSKPPFKPKPDTKEWINWKLMHESWQDWRNENTKEVEKLKEST